MKGWRFYEEFENDKRETSTGNVLAICTTQRPYSTLSFGAVGVGHDVQYHIDCIGATFFEPNSPVCTCSASEKHLRERCKRVSEAKARKIHPKLFEYLEMEA